MHQVTYFPKGFDYDHAFASVRAELGLPRFTAILSSFGYGSTDAIPNAPMKGIVLKVMLAEATHKQKEAQRAQQTHSA